MPRRPHFAGIKLRTSGCKTGTQALCLQSPPDFLDWSPKAQRGEVKKEPAFKRFKGLNWRESQIADLNLPGNYWIKCLHGRDIKLSQRKESSISQTWVSESTNLYSLQLESRTQMKSVIENQEPRMRGIWQGWKEGRKGIQQSGEASMNWGFSSKAGAPGLINTGHHIAP